MPSPIRPAAAVLLTVVLACGTANSQDEQPDGQPANNPAPAAGGGLRAYLDPATGRLIDHAPYGKPTLELDRDTLHMFSSDGFGLIEETLPDGTVKIDLRGRFREGTVATFNDSGDIRIQRIGGQMFLSPTGRVIHRGLTGNQVGDQEDSR